MTAFQDQFGKLEAFIVPWMVEPPGNWTDHLKYLEASGQFHMPYYSQEGTPYGTVDGRNVWAICLRNGVHSPSAAACHVNAKPAEIRCPMGGEEALVHEGCLANI